MQLYSIASGSSGNCIYVGGEEARILIDAGISICLLYTSDAADD